MASIPRDNPYLSASSFPRAGFGGVPWLLLLATSMGYLLLFPPQVSVTIGPLILPAYRAALLGAVFIILAALFNGRLRICLPDLMILGAGVWMAFALSATMGFERASEGAGSQFVDCVIGYFFARTTLRSLTDLRMFLILLAPGLFLTGALIAAESLTGGYIVQPLFAALLGQADMLAASIGYNSRLGLLRAPGPFPHPILAGVFLGSFLTLYSFSAIRGWPKVVGFVAACCAFFTISSAALLVLMAGILTTLYNWASERVAILSWRNFVIVGSILFFVLELATKSGTYSLLVRFASFNSSSSYYRVLTWRYGSASVVEHPVFGIGFAEYERPAWMVISSIDHYWLLLAIQYGIMTPLLVLGAAAYAVVKLGVRSSQYSLADRRLLRGTAVALAVFAMGAISVTLWQSTQVWFFMLLGIAVSLAIATPSARGTQTGQ
ncbi:MAG: hypothetical protein JY451_07700 [Erythrobacter sp.]|nr:MAG: hypothetical protein JY451_07700 [Erythrobacter sp.]